LEGHAGARRAAGRHQRLRQEGAREPVQVPARRVPVHQGRAHRTGVPMTRTKTTPARRLTAMLLTGSLALGVGASRVAWAQDQAAPPAPPAADGAPRKRRQPPPAVIPTEETQSADQLFHAGKYDAAVAQAKAALNKNERYTPAMLVMAKSYNK